MSTATTIMAINNYYITEFNKRKTKGCQFVTISQSLWFSSKRTTTVEKGEVILKYIINRRKEEILSERSIPYEIVFFSVTFDSGRALFNTFRRAVVLARIRECRYACLKQWMGNDRHNQMLYNW